MKTLLSISYWLGSMLLVACMVNSLGYRFGEALFIGSLFFPGALAVKYFYSQIQSGERKTRFRNAVFVGIGILLGEILLFLYAHYLISLLREPSDNIYDWPALPDLMSNPVFISVVIATLSVGNLFFEKWLNRLFAREKPAITFLSGRKPVSLPLEEILYVESNDSVTTVAATQGRFFTNKTPISQWERTLGETLFLRIHRSYLVNRSAVTGMEGDILYLGDIALPVSRKYKKAVREAV